MYNEQTLADRMMTVKFNGGSNSFPSSTLCWPQAKVFCSGQLSHAVALLKAMTCSMRLLMQGVSDRFCGMFLWSAAPPHFRHRPGRSFVVYPPDGGRMIRTMRTLKARKKSPVN